MTPLIHFIVSLIVMLISFPSYSWNVLGVLVGGVLIDIDHLLVYIQRFRKVSSYKVMFSYFNNSDKSDVMGVYCLFHSVELLVVLFVWSFWNELVLMIFTGMLIHFIMDLIDEYKTTKRLIKEWSFVAWVWKMKEKKRKRT